MTRHRKQSRKGTRKGKRHTRRHHKGGYYGAKGPIVQGGDAMEWGHGNEVTPLQSGGRRRKLKKTMKKGGSKYGAVSASFGGTGERGMANYTGISTKTDVGHGKSAALGAFNDGGAHSGNFKSFGGMFPK
jgi:hypothetical protein